MKVTRQSCPRSPAQDFAAGVELFQLLACPALVPAMHITAASTASTPKSTTLTAKSCEITISGKKKINRSVDIWGHQTLPLLVAWRRKLRRASRNLLLGSLLGLTGSTGPRALQGTAVQLLPWPEAKKVHHQRKAGRLRWALGQYIAWFSHGFPGWQVWICKMITSQKLLRCATYKA